MVLGEKQWEEKGKAVGMSVKSIGPEGVHMEQTFTSTTKGLGRDTGLNGTNMGTLTFVQAPDGAFSGNGQGIWTSQGGETVTWKIYFFGKNKAGKGRSFGIVQWRTASKKLARMNGAIGAIEGIADMKTMEMTATGYEWK